MMPGWCYTLYDCVIREKLYLTVHILNTKNKNINDINNNMRQICSPEQSLDAPALTVLGSNFINDVLL